MKSIFCFMSLLSLVLLSSCAPDLHGSAEPRTAGVCFHPMLMGGMPFPMPENAFFNTHHHLVLTEGDGTQHIMVGAFCVIEKK